MASADANVIKKEVKVFKEEVDGVTLRLNQKEAEAVFGLISLVAGMGEFREQINAVYKAMRDTRFIMSGTYGRYHSELCDIQNHTGISDYQNSYRSPECLPE